MTATVPRESTTGWELAQRTRIRAFRADRHLLIVAEGDLPTPGYEVDIQQSPQDVFPPQFDLLWRKPPGIVAQVIQPYRHGEAFPYPADQPTVTVHHRDGHDDVEIEACGEDLADFAAVFGEGDDGAAHEATGMSRSLSFDEAFADAVGKLPQPFPPHPDQLTSVRVVEIGGLFGGIAGFHHLFVKVRGSSD